MKPCRAKFHESPYCPYFGVEPEGEPHEGGAVTAVKLMQNHWGTPATYITTNSMNIDSSPTANMKRYCAFSPRYSTLRPMPLFIGYSGHQRKKDLRIVAATIRKIQAPNQLAAVF